MKIGILALCVGVSLLWCRDAEGATYSDLVSLTSSLFTNYKSDLRPFIDDSMPTSVYMGIWLTSIQELNEIDQSLTFSAFLFVQWLDHRLQWTPSAHNSTQYFAYPQKHMWIPDLTITNSAENLNGLGFDRQNLYVQDDGTVTWQPGGVFTVSCDVDVTYYPFDTQTCSITFSLLASRSNEIDLFSDPSFSTHLDQYSPSGTWELGSFTSYPQGDDQDKARITFDLTMKRRATYYVISIILPVLFLSLTATLVFALPADSGEKMGTSITVLLAFAVYLTIVSDQMPKTSNNVSILSVYLSVLLAQTSLGVVMSVWVLNLHFRDDDKEPPGPRTRSIALAMQRLMCKMPWRDRVTPVNPTSARSMANGDSTLTMSTDLTMYQADQPNAKMIKKSSSSPGNPKAPLPDSKDDADSAPEMMSWKEVSFTFDRFLFYSFSIFLAGSSLVFLLALVIGGNA